MAELVKHLNFDYSGTTPLILGDRYYSQDLIRDLLYGLHKSGQAVKDALGAFPCLISGGIVTKGAGDTLDITPCVGYAYHLVEVPDTFASFPPSKTSVDIVRRISSTQQTNLAISSATLDGSTPNYIKMKYAEANGNTRARAKLTGTYAYERTESFTFVVSSVAPTDYDVVLGILVGTTGSFTITLYLPKSVDSERTDVIGGVGIWPTNTLPNAHYQWARGGSLLRASYPTLWSRYNSSLGSCTISNGADAVVTINAHGLITGACISFSTTGALPASLAINTMYFVCYKDANSFYIASTLANALLNTTTQWIDTSDAGSGTHTLISNPWGFADSTHFYLPDFQSVVPKGFAPVAGRTVGSGAKFSPALGANEEDRFQAWQLGGVNTNPYYGIVENVGQATAGSVAAGFALVQFNTTYQGASTRLMSLSDGTNGTPRAGATTRENSIGINFIIRVI